ncbi:folylpolyglutamate synthase [Colletotrichum tofieldiae]|nr:folylpolyglutamate synthase [Colletotrichum tofieldiae]
MATTGRTYNDAVDALNTLQTPFAVIEARRKAGVRPDEASVKEMRAYLARLGYSPQRDPRRWHKGQGQHLRLHRLDPRAPPRRLPLSVPRKVGLLISPHLIAVRERIRINGAPISEALFARYFFEVWDRLGESTAEEEAVALGTRPIYSRYLTLVSFHAFLQEGCDVAILETGIGGSTTPRTWSGGRWRRGSRRWGSITFSRSGHRREDCVAQGGDHEEGSKAFTVEQVADAQVVLEERAREKGVDMETVGVDPRLQDVKIRPDAAFQKRNASLAIRLAETALEKIDPTGFRRDAEKLPPDFVEGLETVVWRGRCEVKDEGRLCGMSTARTRRIVCGWRRGGSSMRRRRGEKGPEGGRTEAIDFLDGVYNAIKREDGSAFETVVFCTNVTYAQTGYKRDFVNHQYDAKAIEAMTVQRQFAERWSKLDPKADVRVIPTIEEALNHVRGVSEGVAEGESVQAFVTGSLHLVGGALGILEGADAL